MVLPTLAATADLSARGVDVTDSAKVTLALSVASSVVRDAAEAAISPITGTITVSAVPGRVLSLPTFAVAVTGVTVDGDAVTDYRNLGNALWRRCGWSCEPVPVAVTGTFGLSVPDDIVDLTCQLAIAWLDHDAAGGGSTAGLKSAGIDDATEGYTDEAAGQVSPVFVPESTRAWLRARFSGGVAVVDAS